VQTRHGTHHALSVKPVPDVTISKEPARNVPVQVDPDLGVLRTMMAADRTLMAWIRTSLSMFTFGYSLYKILQEVNEIGKLELHQAAPRNVGIMLTMTGTVALAMGIVEYYATLRMLRRSYRFRLAHPTLVMSVVLTFAGGLLCIGIVSRVL
jgi:inner membrane protein YidH